MATISKRAQARTERELQDLLALPGNSICADCGARNPAWASWSLGIFLCMRCATIHRKLGTHISKVKSLSMDTWSPDQVESMKRNGNYAVNKIYNPTNKKPDIPLDADEVDNAMERFIRKKYQEKTLASGKPPVPSRDEPTSIRSKSPDTAPSPALPSKKGKFFGFGLRASSSAYPFSKNDKKNKNEPKVDSAFRIASEDYTSTTRSSASRTEISDNEMESKLAQLRDMGFNDRAVNKKMLKKAQGNVSLVIEALVKRGQSQTPQPDTKPETSSPAPAKPSEGAANKQVSNSLSSAASNNPFDQLDQNTAQSGFGLSFVSPPPQQSSTSQPLPQASPPVNTNPWMNTAAPQGSTGLEQSFANMRVNQPLFPHNTGGYGGQIQHDPRFQQQTTASLQPQWSTNTSPVIGNNPFTNTPLSAHSTGSNPYAAYIQNMPTSPPSNNPFLAQQQTAPVPQQTSPSLVNPFGLPPTNQQSRPASGFVANQAQPNIFDNFQSSNQSLNPYGQNYQSQQTFTPTFQSDASPATSSPGFPNFQYGQPRPQPQSPPQFQQLSAQSPPAVYGNQYHPQPLAAQPTGRYAKNDILALFNYPQFAPQKPLASIPEPEEVSQTQNSRQPLSAGSLNVYAGQTDAFVNNQQSATMQTQSPIQDNNTSRNPFLQAASSSPNTQPQKQLFPPTAYTPVGLRHASADSISVNNTRLMDGRHSPDAFANLSARSMR